MANPTHKIVYIELYADNHDADCGDPKPSHAVSEHVVATTENGRKLELSVTAAQVPKAGTPERAAFEANPPILADVTGNMGFSCGAWQYVRDL